MSNLLSQASLVMIPSGYKEDVVYSQIPTDGSGDLSFTRASNGTRINSAGLVEVVPWNLLQQSETFDNASWSKLGATVTANDITAPNGTLTADKVVFSGANNSIYQAVSLNGEITTRFVYIKGTAGETISIDDIYVSQPNITLTGDWQLIGFTSATPSLRGFAISTYGGATARTIWLWGAQANIGSTAKPYFPTTDRLNVPRLTYQNGGGGCPSLLLEKQSTNLALYSEQFDNAAWSKNNTTVTANASTSPDGTQNADKLIADNGASLSSISNYALQSITKAASAIQYTYSTFVKQGGLNRINIIAQGASIVNNASATFSLLDGTITTAATAAGAFTGASASVSDYGNGWYRCALVFTTNTDTDLIIRNIPTDSTLTTGNGTNGILIYGAQLEASSYPTSYIPTTSSSATRVADACFKTGISSLIGQTQGTLFVDVTEEAQNNGRYIFVSDGSATNRVVIYQAGEVINVYCSAGATFNLTYSPPAGRLKIAFVYKSGDYALWVNGVQRATSTETAVPTGLSATGIGSNENSIGTPEPIDAGVNQAILFPTRLTNAELASLTTI